MKWILFASNEYTIEFG